MLILQQFLLFFQLFLELLEHFIIFLQFLQDLFIVFEDPVHYSDICQKLLYALRIENDIGHTGISALIHGNKPVVERGVLVFDFLLLSLHFCLFDLYFCLLGLYFGYFAVDLSFSI